MRTDASGECRQEGLVLVRKRPRARSAGTSGSVVSSTRAVRIARPETPPMFVLRSTRSMRSSHSLDRLDTAFDDDRLVADAGLLLPATFAHHLGLRELVETHLDLGQGPGRANVGDKLLTLVMAALAGGECIDDAGALGAGSTARVLGFAVKAASTLGTFLRSFRWGHVRQLDAVTRHLLARAWAAEAGSHVRRAYRFSLVWSHARPCSVYVNEKR